MTIKNMIKPTILRHLNDEFVKKKKKINKIYLIGCMI